jgi:bromodomain and WD repeat domain-containing protein 1/3
MSFKENNHFGKLSGELKCLAISWSATGTYALGSFSRRLRRRGDQEKCFP